MSKYLERAHARLMKRVMRADDDEWKTINGTHVLVEKGSGAIKGGPKALKEVSQKATKGGTQTYKPKTSSAYRKAAKFIRKNGIPAYFSNKGSQSTKDVYRAISKYGKLNDAEQKIFDKIKMYDGSIYWNGATRDVTGYTDDEIRGAKMFMAKHAAEHAMTGKSVDNSLPFGGNSLKTYKDKLTKMLDKNATWTKVSNYLEDIADDANISGKDYQKLYNFAKKRHEESMALEMNEPDSGKKKEKKNESVYSVVKNRHPMMDDDPDVQEYIREMKKKGKLSDEIIINSKEHQKWLEERRKKNKPN